MNHVDKFPYIPKPGGNGPLDLVPLLPFRLEWKNIAIDVVGLVDTGTSFSTLPYDVGVQFGWDWNSLAMSLMLGGTASGIAAKMIVVQGLVGSFSPLPLLFAWAQDNSLPVLLGQANFFLEFDVCFFRSRSEFQIQPKTP